MATRTDYLKLHFIVFLWGFTAILGKLVSIPAMEMVLFRALLAALGMGVVIASTRGTFNVSGLRLFYLLLIGVLVGFHWVCFFESARVANVSVSLAGFATNSLWAALLEPAFNRSRVKKFELILGLVVLGGLYVIFSFDFQYKFGLFLGVMAGFTSALFSVFNAKLVRHIPSFTITFYEMIGAFIGLALFVPVYKTIWAPTEPWLFVPTLADWGYIATLALVCSVYAYSQAVELMKKITVFLLQLSLNLEPLYGIAMAVVMWPDKEKMPPNFYLGFCIILGAVIVYPMMKKRYDRQLTPQEE